MIVRQGLLALHIVHHVTTSEKTVMRVIRQVAEQAEKQAVGATWRHGKLRTMNGESTQPNACM